MQMARRNRPRAEGIVVRISHAVPPADCPAMVTFAGSPPNVSMFSWTHSSAATQSSTPRLPPSSWSCEEALEAEAVVDAHQHHAVTGEPLARGTKGWRCSPEKNPPPWIHTMTGSPAPDPGRG